LQDVFYPSADIDVNESNQHDTMSVKSGKPLKGVASNPGNDDAVTTQTESDEECDWNSVDLLSIDTNIDLKSDILISALRR
jgi:hypothetical protein